MSDDKDRPTPEEYRKIEEEIYEILKKYQNLSVTLIVKADEAHGYLICGNMCPVCSAEILVEYVLIGQLEHHSEEDKVVDKAITNLANGGKKVH